MDPRVELLVNLLILLGMLVTLCGLIVPVFPGLVVIWALALLYGILSGFGMLGVVLFVIITALAILGEISDNLLMSRKARQEGARWLSIAIAFVAGIVGSMVFSPLGGIAAALGGLFWPNSSPAGITEQPWRSPKAWPLAGAGLSCCGLG